VGQFKYSRSFYWLCFIHKKSNITHCWNFFETGHGKVEYDSAGACVKRGLQRYQMKPHANQWCKLALIHENNPSMDVHMCVYIYMLHKYTRYFYSHVQIYMIFNHFLDRFQVNKFLSCEGFFGMLESKM
jgi:hypothetical protein